MRVGVIPPAEDAGVRDMGWKEIAKPVDAIARRPGFLPMSVQAVDRDDAAGNMRKSGSVSQHAG